MHDKCEVLLQTFRCEFRMTQATSTFDRLGLLREEIRIPILKSFTSSKEYLSYIRAAVGSTSSLAKLCTNPCSQSVILRVVTWWRDNKAY